MKLRIQNSKKKKKNKKLQHLQVYKKGKYKH